jgi:hypothetical protein
MGIIHRYDLVIASTTTYHGHDISFNVEADSIHITAHHS